MGHLIEGNISVKACLQAEKREVTKLIIDKQKHDKDTNYIKHLAISKNIPIEYLERNEIDEMASGQTHGGLLAIVEERQLDTLTAHLDDEFIAIVEGIEDPYNFGYICRSLYSAGVKLIMVPERNWTSVVDVVTKASAGASEYLNFAPLTIDNINICKEHGFVFYTGNRKDATSLYETTFSKKVLLAVGGELRGLSKTIAKEADHNIYIPYANDFRNALNGASATAIIAFEIFRQKQQ